MVCIDKLTYSKSNCKSMSEMMKYLFLCRLGMLSDLKEGISTCLLRSHGWQEQATSSKFIEVDVLN